MEFKTNIRPVDVIKKSAFGGTYFRDIYSGVNDKWYRNSWKEFKELEGIEKKIIVLTFMISVLTNMVLC